MANPLHYQPDRKYAANLLVRPMPELPEVQTVVSTLRPRVVGGVITGVEVLRPDYIEPAEVNLAEKLAGQVIRDIHRRGKRIIFTLGSGSRFLIHLGMTGRLTAEPPKSERPKHTHLVLHVILKNRQVEVRLVDPRRFGRVLWLGDESAEAGLGLEPLTLRPKQLCLVLSASRRPIKSLLLDQTRIAGLGNIYVDESLFMAGIHPLTPANEVGTEAAMKLCRATKAVLRKALRHRGSTLRDYVDAEGGKGSFQKLHNVYARAGQSCRKCGTPIERVVLGGRSTCFCPRCQKRHDKRLPKN